MDNPPRPTTIGKALELFCASKRGEGVKSNTLSHHKMTGKRLSALCDRQGIRLVNEITPELLFTLRNEWRFTSKLTMRVEQQRVKTFFKFCKRAGMLRDNPAEMLSAIRISNDERTRTMPFTDVELKAIFTAIPRCGFTAEIARKVRALMLLQRWAGLSIQDAVMLRRENLIATFPYFRVKTRRVKTGVEVNNVIPDWVGRELLRVSNRQPAYFFYAGGGTGKTAASYWMRFYAEVFKTAGISDGHSHRFRDTAACELLAAGLDIRKVAKFLGHTSVVITERYYAPWMQAEQDALDEEISEAWRTMDGQRRRPERPKFPARSVTAAKLRLPMRYFGRTK